MEAPRVGPAHLRLPDIAPASPDAVAIPLGQPLPARVGASLGEGRWTIEVGGRTFAARSLVPLAPGTRLEVVASRSGTQLELRIVGADARFDEVQFAAAVLAQAGARAVASPAVIPREGALAAEIAAALAAIDPGAPAEAVAAALRDLLENGGLLLERRLRRWLETSGRRGRDDPSADDPELPAEVRGDLRARLAAAGAATPERADAARALAEQLLARQVDFAYQWLRDGTLRLQLPVVVGGHNTVAELHVEPDAQPGASSGTPARQGRFDMRFELPDVGRIRVVARWAPSEIEARIVVEREEVRALAEPEIARLGDGLRRAGFASVRAAIDVDPDALRRSEPAAGGDGAAAGRIFEARA